MKTRHESNKQNIFIRSMSVSLCAAFFITNVVGAQAPKTDNDSRLRHSGMTLQLNKGSRLKTSGTSFWSERQKAVKAAKEYAQLPGNSPVSLFNKGHTSIPSFSKGGLGSIIPDITGIEAKAKQQNATTVPNSIAKNGPGWLRSLPYNYGTLEEFYASPQKGSPVVVFVQDVHGHYEAQLNIANIIQEIVNREQKDGNVVTTPDKSGNYNELNNSPVIIGLEGAVGAFNFSSYRAFPNKEINKEIADYFLKSGLISGPEYTGLVSDTEPMFWGVEDKDTYLANIEAFKESLSLRDNAKKQIETAARRVVDLKRKIYSPEMRSLDEKIEGYHNGTLGLGEYLEYLSRPNVLAQLLKHERVTELQRGNGAYQGIYKKASTSPPVIGRRPEHETATAPDKSGNYNSAIKNPKSTKFPNVRQFLDTFKLEKTINFQKVEDERRILIEKLVNVLSKEELESLVYQAVSYRMGNIDNGTYYRGLEAVCQKHGLKLNNWPELAQYVRYTIGADRIDRRALFKEINGVEDKVVAQFTGGEALSSFRIERRSTTPDKSGNYMIVAMDVYEISKNLALISKLIDNNLTDEEWKTYLSNKEKIHSIFSRLNAVAQSPIKTFGDKLTGGETQEAKHSRPLGLSSFRIERRLNNDATTAPDKSGNYTTTTPDKSGNYTTTAPDKSGNYNERYNGKMSFPFETFEKFYETATSRNRILVENLLSANSTLTSTCRISLLVAGGFHTQSMAKLLKEKQISYAVLSPKLTEIDQESHYLDVFAQKSTPLDKLMLGEKIFLAAYRNMGSVVPLAPSQMEVRHNLLGGLQVALGTMGLSSSEIEQAKARFERLIKRLPAIKDAQVGNTYEARNGDHVVPVWINGHGFAVAVSQLKDGVSREVTIEGQVSGKMRNFAFTIRPLTIKEKSTQIIPITQAKAKEITPTATEIVRESLKIAAVVTLVTSALYLIFSGNHQFAGAVGMFLIALDYAKAAEALRNAAYTLRKTADVIEITSVQKLLQFVANGLFFIAPNVEQGFIPQIQLAVEEQQEQGVDKAVEAAMKANLKIAGEVAIDLEKMLDTMNMRKTPPSLSGVIKGWYKDDKDDNERYIKFGEYKELTSQVRNKLYYAASKLKTIKSNISSTKGMVEWDRTLEMTRDALSGFYKYLVYDKYERFKHDSHSGMFVDGERIIDHALDLIASHDTPAVKLEQELNKQLKELKNKLSIAAEAFNKEVLYGHSAEVKYERALRQSSAESKPKGDGPALNWSGRGLDEVDVTFGVRPVRTVRLRPHELLNSAIRKTRREGKVVNLDEILTDARKAKLPKGYMKAIKELLENINKSTKEPVVINSNPELWDAYFEEVRNAISVQTGLKNSADEVVKLAKSFADDLLVHPGTGANNLKPTIHMAQAHFEQFLDFPDIIQARILFHELLHLALRLEKGEHPSEVDVQGEDEKLAEHYGLMPFKDLLTSLEQLRYQQPVTTIIVEGVTKTLEERTAEEVKVPAKFKGVKGQRGRRKIRDEESGPENKQERYEHMINRIKTVLGKSEVKALIPWKTRRFLVSLLRQAETKEFKVRQLNDAEQSFILLEKPLALLESLVTIKQHIGAASAPEKIESATTQFLSQLLEHFDSPAYFPWEQQVERNRFIRLVEQLPEAQKKQVSEGLIKHFYERKVITVTGQKDILHIEILMILAPSNLDATIKTISNAIMGKGGLKFLRPMGVKKAIELLIKYQSHSEVKNLFRRLSNPDTIPGVYKGTWWKSWGIQKKIENALKSEESSNPTTTVPMQPVKIAGLFLNVGLITVLTWATVLSLDLSGVAIWNNSWPWAMGIGSALSLIMVSLFKWEAKRYIEEIKDASNIGVLWGLTLLGRPVRTKEIAETKKEALSLSLIMRHLEMINGKPQLDAFESELLDNFRDMIVENLKVKGKLSSEDEQKIKALNFELFLPQRPAEDKKRVGLGGIVGTIKDISHVRNNRAPPEVTAQLVYDKTTSQLKTIRIIPSKTLDILFAKSFVQDLIGDLGIFDAQKPDDLIRLISLVSPIAKNYAPKNFKTIIRGLSSVSFRARESVLRILEIKLTTRLASSRLAQVIYHEIGHVVYGKSNEIAATWMERHAGLRAWPRIIINIPLLVLKKALWGSRSEGRNIVFTDATSGMGKLLAWMFSVSKDNVAIYVRDRNATAELPVESKRLKYVQSENKSLADKSLLTKLIKGNDVFFHHAGIPLPKKDVPNDQQYELLAINGFLTGTITELIKTFNPDSKLIYTSSQMVYVLENKPAILDDTLPVTYSDETELWLTTAVAEFKEWFAELKDDQFETALIEFTKGFIGRYGYPHIPGGKGLVDPYSLSKALGERFVMELENYAIMRPTNFIGLGYPYESGRTIPKNIKAIKDGGTIPTSDEFRDFVDTQDAAKVWMEAAALPRGQQTINVASGKMTHIRNVYQAAWVKLRSRNNLPEESARQATQPYEVKNDTAKHLLGREFRNVVEYVGAYVDYMNADIKGKRKILNSTTKSRGGVELIPLFILGALGVLGLGVAALLANDMFDFGQTLNMVMNWKTWQSVALPMLGTGLSAFVFSIMFQQGMRGHNPSRWGHAEASEVRTTAGLLKDGEPIHGRTGDTWNIHQRIPPRDLAGIGLGIYDFKVESTESGKTLEEFLAAKDARLISRIKEGKSLVFLNHEQISDLSVKLNTGDSIGIVPRISGGSGREDETSGAFELYSAEIAALSGKSRWDKKKIAYLLERLLQSLAVMENRVVSSGHHSLPANIAQARTLYDNNKTLQDVPRFDNVDSAIKRLITVRENNVELSSYSLGYLITALWAGDKIPEDELQDWTLTASAVNYALEHKEDISRTIRYIWQHSYVGSRRVVLDSLDRKQNPLLPLWMYKQQVFSTNLMVDRLLEHYTFRYEIETVLKKGKYLTSDVWEYWHIIAYSALYFYGNDLIAELARETGDTPNMPPMLGGLNYEQLVAFIEKVNSGETPLADLIGYFHQTGLDQISIALEHLSAEYHQAFNEGITSLSVMTPLPIVSGSDLENIITQTFVPGGHYYNELQSFLDEQAAIVANYYLLESSYGQFYKDVENFQEGNYLITVEVSADLRDGIGTVKIKIGRIDKKELAPNELNELKRHLFQLIVEESPGKTHSLEPKQFTLDWEENRGVIEHTVSAMFGFYAFGQASHYQLGAWGTTKYEHSAEQQVIKVIMKLHGGQKDDTTVFFGMGINPFPKKLDGSIDWQATWQALKNHAWLTLGLIAIAGVLGYSMGPKMAVYAMGAGFGLAAAYFNNLRVSGQNGSVEDGRIDVKRATQKFNELLEDLENANKAKDDTALKTYRQALAMLLADVINGAKEIIKSGTNKWDISDVDYFDELVSLASVIYVRLLADKNIRFDAVKDTLQTQLYAGEETDAEKWLKISNLIKTDSETTTANNHDLAFTAEVPTREALEQLFDKVVQDGRLQRLLNIESMFEAQKGKTFEENVLSLEAGQYHVVVKINGNKETHKGVITLTVERNDKQKFHKNERMSLTDVFVFEMRNNSNAEGSIYKQFEIKNDGLTMGLGFGFNLDEGRILDDKVAGKVDGHVINKAQLQNFHRIVPLAMRLQESEKTSARPIKLTISRYDHRITLEQFLQDNELIDYVNRTNYVVRVNGNPIRVADFTKTILLTWDRVIISPIGGGFGKNGESDKESDALWDIGQWEYHREVPKEKSRDWYNQAFEVFNSVGIETKMIGDRKISAIWLIDNKMPRGMYAYNFHIIDGYRLPHEVIVTNEPVTPGSIAEEAAFHENEAYYWVHGRNMATMTAHVLAAARQRLVFGKNGLTRFDQEQIANMPLDRVERLRAEDQSERHWHHNLIEKYLSSYELEQIQVYEQRFRDAVQLKALLESVFNSPDSEDYQELQRFIGKTSQVLFEGGMIIREPEHRISIKGDYQFTVSIIPLKGKNYWHSETMHMYGYRGRIEFRVFRSGADRLSPEEMEMINQYLLLLSVKSGHRIEQSPARRLTLDPNVPNAMRASFEISKEGEIAQTGDGLVMNSKPNLQIIPLTIELNSIYNEISPSSTDPVMRWSGKGLTEDQHDVVNTAITEHFPGAFQVEHGRLLIPGSEEYQALDPEGVLRERSIRIYVLEGLNQRVAELALGRGIEPPVDLVTHPGRNRGQLYLDATTLPILLGYGEAWRAAWARHELAHILNPSKNERIIQMLAPLPSVTPELQKSAEQNKFTELLTDLIKEMESIIASYAAENSTIKIADSMYNLVEALKQIGPDPKNLAPVLTIYMQHKIYGRDIISNFLAKISIDSVPYLINILDTTNIESDFHLLVHDVAETLGQIGPEAKSSIPLLVKFFLSYSTKTITARIRTTIINALNQIDKEKEYDLLHELFVERYQYVSDKKSYTYLQRTIKKEFGPILVELEESMNNILKNYHKDRDANVLIDSTNTLLDKTITKIRNLLKDGTQSTHAFDLPGLKRGIKVAAKAAGVLLPFLVISGVNLTGLIVHVPQLHEFLVFHPAIRSLITALTIVDLFALGTLVKFGAMFGYTRQMEKLRINVTSIETNGRIEALWRRASGERLLTEQVKSELKITGSLLAPVWNLFVGWFVRNVEIHEMFQEHSDGMMALVPAVGTQLGKTGIASALVAKNADRTTTTSSGWLDNLVVPLRKASKGVQNSLEDAQVVNGAGAIFNLKVQREALENNRKIVYLARVMMADEAKNNSRHVSSATLPEEVPFVNVTELQESSREIIQRIEARLNRISSEDVKLRQLISNLSKNEQVGFALGLEIAEVENQGTDVLADTARKQAKQIEVILNSAQVNSEETLVSHAREINRGHIGSRRLKKAGELKNEVVNMSAVTGEQRTDTQNITRTVTTLDVDVLLKTNGQEGTEQVITTLEAYNKAKQNISGSSDMQLVLVSRANLSARTIRRSVREVLIAEDVDVEMLTHLMTATVHNGKYLRKHDMIQEINLDDGTKEMLIVTERYVQDWRKNDYSVNIVTDNADWTAIQDKLVQIFLYAIGDRLINVSETIDSYRSFRQAINIQA